MVIVLFLFSPDQMIGNWTLGSIVYFAVVVIVSLKVSRVTSEGLDQKISENAICKELGFSSG